MATLKPVMDKRKMLSDKEKPCPLKVALAHRQSTTYIGLDLSVLPSQWDSVNQAVVNHPKVKELNHLIRKKIGELEDALFHLSEEQDINSLTVTEIKNELIGVCAPKSKKACPNADSKPVNSVKIVFENFIKLKSGQTKALYETTLRKLIAHVGEQKLAAMHFEDINQTWLLKFEKFLSNTAPSANARAIHLRNLRAVCNFAIDNEITNYFGALPNFRGNPTNSNQRFETT